MLGLNWQSSWGFNQVNEKPSTAGTEKRVAGWVVGEGTGIGMGIWRVWVKVCGLTRMEEVEAAVRAGADAVGFVFAPSRRQVTPEQVRNLTRAVPDGVDRVGVFVDERVERVQAVAEYCRLNVLQFHGSEPPEYCSSFDGEVIKAIRVLGTESLREMERYRGAVDCYLLDTYVEGQHGGSGKTFEWSWARKAVEAGYPVIVAGGLGPDNVILALREVNPQGVDASSGLETGGKKESEKITTFVQVVRAWEAAQGRRPRVQGGKG